MLPAIFVYLVVAGGIVRGGDFGAGVVVNKGNFLTTFAIGREDTYRRCEFDETSVFAVQKSIRKNTLTTDSYSQR
jgi:hypothetical protein